VPGHRDREDLIKVAGPRRILTVCKGGHCRSPLAAAVLAQRGGPVVETRAAAIRAWHIGEGAHPVMVAVAAERGWDLSGHRGIQVSPDLLDWADVVLAMDGAVLDELHGLADQRSAVKIALYLDGQDVPDPWQQPREAFTACVVTVEAGANRHLITP
jgi:protein-tyrosine phosphatase